MTLFWLVIGNLARECRVLLRHRKKMVKSCKNILTERKLYQIAWQPSKGGVRLAKQG